MAARMLARIAVAVPIVFQALRGLQRQGPSKPLGAGPYKAPQGPIRQYRASYGHIRQYKAVWALFRRMHDCTHACAHAYGGPPSACMQAGMRAGTYDEGMPRKGLKALQGLRRLL